MKFSPWPPLLHIVHKPPVAISMPLVNHRLLKSDTFTYNIYFYNVLRILYNVDLNFKISQVYFVYILFIDTVIPFIYYIYVFSSFHDHPCTILPSRAWWEISDDSLNQSPWLKNKVSIYLWAHLMFLHLSTETCVDMSPGVLSSPLGMVYTVGHGTKCQ